MVLALALALALALHLTLGKYALMCTHKTLSSRYKNTLQRVQTDVCRNGVSISEEVMANHSKGNVRMHAGKYNLFHCWFVYSKTKKSKSTRDIAERLITSGTYWGHPTAKTQQLCCSSSMPIGQQEVMFMPNYWHYFPMAETNASHYGAGLISL